ncbi:LppU/SCO3897 family protein [Streptomyces bambusae]|uniref:Serine/threonine protein kinase n=1 Tax=Streptomyces bambusae TaxID=1550616 RepID=A0ABS6Z560_9ACTN|nr:hypothetical protein [Streptomyces bambusae]MBW5482514.1 hypothetical protein [Streptomyces bambusae]
MSPEEIPVDLTPQQAAHGVVLPMNLPSGPARVRIPHTEDGALVRARVGQAELLLRIRVVDPSAPAAAPTVPVNMAAAPGAPAGPAAPTASSPNAARGCLIAAGVVAAALVALALFDSGDDSRSTTSAPTPSSSYSGTYSPAPATPEPDATSDAPQDTSTSSAPEPVATPSETAPSPFDRGTCLGGELPDSTTAQRVTGVEEVPCSASDAHYRVIESIPGTSDLNSCDDNSDTEYAFSYCYTRNGIPINQYVYCLVGIGPYARG